jgi:chitinase
MLTSRPHRRYIDLGIDPQKINLGFAFYAKYFQTTGSCPDDQLPTGCPIAQAQSENGTDLYTSGVLTYEPHNMNRTYPVLTDSLAVATDGHCGWVSNVLTNNKCPEGYCCGESGWCGDTTEHCRLNCQAGYGRCDGPDVAASFQRAQANSIYDAKEGGIWYIDTSITPNLFWTWENDIVISRKFDEIVNNQTHTLGGVSGWSLGEDSFDWSRVKMLREIARMHTPVSPTQTQTQTSMQTSMQTSTQIQTQTQTQTQVPTQTPTTTQSAGDGACASA